MGRKKKELIEMNKSKKPKTKRGVKKRINLNILRESRMIKGIDTKLTKPPDIIYRTEVGVSRKFVRRSKYLNYETALKASMLWVTKDKVRKSIVKNWKHPSGTKWFVVYVSFYE